MKLRVGTGMYLAIYSQTTSMFILFTADTGKIGDASATVPETKVLI